MIAFKPIAADLAAFLQQRPGETRLGAAVLTPTSLRGVLPPSTELTLEVLPALLQHAVAQGVKVVILGIPEDIGPRANLGLGGSDGGFKAFLSRFVNLQANHFLPAQQILLLGEIDVDDLQQQSLALDSKDDTQLAELRALCQQLDERVSPILQLIFAHGLFPIVLGGGHNNAYPLLKALSSAAQQAVHAINLDPHCDFRLLEGRHSGNGFSYAKTAGYLHSYQVLALHEHKNADSALALMQQHQVGFISYQQIMYQQPDDATAALPTLTQPWPAAVARVCRAADAEPERPLAVEVDTDSISYMPVSAFTNCGISVADAEYYVYQLCRRPQAAYLHLAEAAPARHPAGLAQGMNEAGQILSALVLAALHARLAPH